MGSPVTADWLQQVRERHDPLAAWSGVGRPGASDYRWEAQLAAADLREVLGLGHARTVVADALGRVHPGVYQAFAAAGVGDELNARLGRVAREIWNRHGSLLGWRRASRLPGYMLPPSSSMRRSRTVLAFRQAAVMADLAASTSLAS